MDILEYERTMNMEDIHELYNKAGELHGHYCPGLAIGVRAAAIAAEKLPITDKQSKSLYCVAEKSACFLDGIQALAGCTFGKGNLIYRPTGKTAFTFYDTAEGKSLRLMMKAMPEGLDRQQKTEFILTAQAEDVFQIGKARFPLPKGEERRPEIPCSVCGELTDEGRMRVVDGKPVCLDCAGL